MLIFTETSEPEFQVFPESTTRPHFVADEQTANRILGGEAWKLSADKKSVVFISPEEVAEEKAAADLAAERAGMVVSRFQARAALMGAGYLESAESAIQAAGPIAQLAWADAQSFERNSNLVASIAGELGLTDEQIDDLFRQAKTITT